ALRDGSTKALLAVEANGRESAMDREEALYEATASLNTLDAYRNYLTKYPKGYYALDISVALANGLAKSNVTEAEKVLTEAATLGGNRPKATANFRLALLRHGKGDKAGATSAFRAAADAATLCNEFDVEVQSHYNL